MFCSVLLRDQCSLAPEELVSADTTLLTETRGTHFSSFSSLHMHRNKTREGTKQI